TLNFELGTVLLSEFDLIARFKKILPQSLFRDWTVSIGDDCAVRRLSRNRYELLTQDLLLEDVHFLSGSLRHWEEIGWKSLAVNLSDLAAMGGRPVGAVIGLALPSAAKTSEAEALYRGLAAAARRYACPVVGGDTNASKGAWMIAISMLGETRHRPLLRSAARSGDSLWVSGELGTAALGWRAIQRQDRSALAAPFRRRHALPEPRLAWGEKLAQSGMVGAMIDVSDGLAGDLAHLEKASKVGFEVELENLPRHRDFSKLCSRLDVSEVEMQLAGGEDYELLFTVQAGLEKKFQKFAAVHGLKVTCIGNAVKNRGIHWLQGGRNVKKSFRGF
ncbi:MAG TPA: thiamine-phosphate kinase, partial [Deltaproteobacteria bacterium]|nr:thiamine-phosphate kinase [Deltaproteobacteria bacterium]